jgi:hypothetical protein
MTRSDHCRIKFPRGGSFDAIVECPYSRDLSEKDAVEAIQVTLRGASSKGWISIKSVRLETAYQLGTESVTELRHFAEEMGLEFELPTTAVESKDESRVKSRAQRRRRGSAHREGYLSRAER